MNNVVLTTAFCLMCSVPAFAVPLQKAKITVVGHEGETTLEDFPVLVRISETRITGFQYSDCSQGGSDISFALSDGTDLPYEIDTWNPQGESLVWVKLPALSGTETSFYMRWQDNTPSQNTPTDVWSDDYIGVWHMGMFNASNAVPDATGNGYEAKIGSTATLSTGEGLCKIGAAVQNGEGTTGVNGGGLRVRDYESQFPGAGISFTCTAWIYLPGNADKNVNHTIFDKKLSNGDAWNARNGWFAQILSKGNPVDSEKLKRLRFVASNDTMLDQTSQNIVFAGAWRHVCITGSNGRYYFYVDGEKIDGFNKTVYSSTGKPFVMMCAKYGIIDECRMRNGVVSDDWIKNEYGTMADEGYLQYDSAESNIGNSLDIAGLPNAIGTPSPGYGEVADVAAGETYTLSMESTEVPAEGTAKYCLKGWKLESVSATGEKTLVDEYDQANDNLQSYEYTHGGKAIFTWIWEERDALGIETPVVVENGGDHLDFTVNVTGVDYSGEPATLKFRYGVRSGEYLWEHSAASVSGMGVIAATLPDLTPGVCYYILAQLVSADGASVQTAPFAIRTNAIEGGATTGNLPIANITLDGTGANTLLVNGELVTLNGDSAAISVLVGKGPETMTNVWTGLSGSTLNAPGSFNLTLAAEMGSAKYLVPGETYCVSLLVTFSDGTASVTTPIAVTMSKLDGWTYVETTRNADNSGSGYVTDGVWKFTATRRKDTNNLTVRGTGDATFYGTGESSLDFTKITDAEGASYHVVALSSLLSWNGQIGPKPNVYDCRNMVTEVIATNCTSIGGRGCFYKCTALTNVIFAEGLTIPVEEVFRGCAALQTIWPRVFSTLPEYTFAGCGSLKGAISLTESTSIPNSLFNGCASLEEVSAPYAAAVASHGFCNCSNLTNVNLGSVVAIYDYAFYNCAKLKTGFVQGLLGAKLRTLWTKDYSNTHQGWIFYGCTGLGGTLHWNLPNLSTNVVAKELFNGCTNLSAVVFHTPIAKFYNKAFYSSKAGGPDIYMPAEPPASYESCAVMSAKAPYSKVYLKDNYEDWLAVMDRNGDDLILKEAFNDSSRYSGAKNWATITDCMANDGEMCSKDANGVVAVKDKRVLAFMMNGDKYGGCWVLRMPRRGFMLLVQ
jgi:hypothetical protein